MQKDNGTEEAGETNRDLWEAIYRRGSILRYPSEMLVRVFFRHCRQELPENATILEHGAGTGNNTEFLIRQGYRVIATDISEAALQTMEMRFTFANLPQPEKLLIDPARALSGQLPPSDAVVVWDCISYNTAERARKDIADLIASLRPGGLFIINAATPAHDFITQAAKIAPNTYRYEGETRPGQKGAIFNAPDSLPQFREWCAGLEILHTGGYAYWDEQRKADYFYLVGRRAE